MAKIFDDDYFLDEVDDDSIILTFILLTSMFIFSYLT